LKSKIDAQQVQELEEQQSKPKKKKSWKRDSLAKDLEGIEFEYQDNKSLSSKLSDQQIFSFKDEATGRDKQIEILNGSQVSK
jgi:hypothetical protein